ncbi:copper resistance CopC/CopD family protein [Streptomyces sp. MUSC 125]|uniref:copper resistance CopC/CopD family protein n=1 Tax=Streptomyces sp. MUSC 125 TaxID=1428624 RepID=UPI000A837294|nr:copper resistance protein CopC [Streptomyces sp. MUSC 125]
MVRRLVDDGRHTALSVLVVVAALALALLRCAAPAAAHAVLTASDPREGSVWKTAPKQVTVTFDESVALMENSLRVLGPDNRPVTAGDPTHVEGRADTARVSLTSRLGQGTYTVSWRVVSADSHAVSGAFTFSVGKPSQTRALAATRPAVAPAVNTLYGIGRYLAYAGLALLLGVAVFVLVCWPSATAVRVVRRPLLAGWWVLFGATVLALLLRGPYDSGVGPGGMIDPELLWRTAGTRPGVALLARLVLLLAAAVPARRRRGLGTRPSRRAATAAVAFALALAATWALSDHAATGVQVPVAVVSSVLHLLAMAVWLGGLAALLTALYRAPAEDPLPLAAVSRFSRLALTAVAVLAATGVYQSWRGLGSWGALFGTGYGRLLVYKVWSVLLMLAVAWHSRRFAGQLLRLPHGAPVPATVGGDPGLRSGRATGAVGREEPGRTAAGSGPPAQQRGLRRTVTAEVAVGVAVLVLTTVLTGTQPGRAATEAAAVRPTVPGQPDVSLTLIPYDTGKDSLAGRGKLQITLEPGGVGRNVVEAIVYGADGSPISVPELRLTFTLADRHVGPLNAHLADETGYWGSDTLDLPLAGTWTVKATVRVSDIDQVTVSKTVAISR